MAAADPEAHDADVEVLDEEEPKKISTVEFHMSKLEELEHGDAMAKLRLVRKVTALLKAQKLGKVHPEKVERRKTPIVQEVKAVHTEEDERDEACTLLFRLWQIVATHLLFAYSESIMSHAICCHSPHLRLV